MNLYIVVIIYVINQWKEDQPYSLGYYIQNSIPINVGYQNVL